MHVTPHVPCMHATSHVPCAMVSSTSRVRAYRMLIGARDPMSRLLFFFNRFFAEGTTVFVGEGWVVVGGGRLVVGGRWLVVGGGWG